MCECTCANFQQIIQRRDDYGEPSESFNRDWDDYKYGFGKADQEVWLGNENIFLLTKASEYEMRVDLEDFDGNKRYKAHLMLLFILFIIKYRIFTNTNNIF